MRRFCNARCHAEIADDELTLFAEEYMLHARTKTINLYKIFFAPY